MLNYKLTYLAGTDGSQKTFCFIHSQEEKRKALKEYSKIYEQVLFVFSYKWRIKNEKECKKALLK
ncbi:hypothetical protein [Leptospira stimsonii]|uniref:Uncharacterized protein n=1 Tax=Leptospira stimsonii TaxID=2202203 RepID=A0A396ZC57_9LEPT|nr:hypothetical protein [Leptospira stimsonii]RHX93089.1 hypothetical protein DLM75_08055 [Leptospira stimsonii]